MAAGGRGRHAQAPAWTGAFPSWPHRPCPVRSTRRPTSLVGRKAEEGWRNWRVSGAGSSRRFPPRPRCRTDSWWPGPARA